MYLSCTILQLLENIKEREVVRIVETYNSTDNVDKVFTTSDYTFGIIKLFLDIYKGYQSITKHIKEHTYL